MFVTPLVAAILLGSTFWTGVAATSAFHNSDMNGGVAVSANTSAHEDACAARYHSYRTDNDSWLGRDGHWHVCTL